ncbi:unnamed protein product [Prorocentrum cordatum]|uniref:Uncharacterized protein n=1 Tax=Prorocentrum cordatum TaxID=2364126 RepID=A0ABN9W8W9_9DINO|nr:unnamed protein product [Polarella glacialis]
MPGVVHRMEAVWSRCALASCVDVCAPLDDKSSRHHRSGRPIGNDAHEFHGLPGGSGGSTHTHNQRICQLTIINLSSATLCQCYGQQRPRGQKLLFKQASNVALTLMANYRRKRSTIIKPNESESAMPTM